MKCHYFRDDNGYFIYSDGWYKVEEETGELLPVVIH